MVTDIPRISYASLLMFTAMLLNGCSAISHDAALDQRQISKDQPYAESVARALGSADLDCQNVSDKVLSRTDAEGAPMGPVWSDYTISVQGCGKSATYQISCKGLLSKPNCYKAK